MGMDGTWKIANLERIMYYLVKLDIGGEIFLHKIENNIGGSFNGSPPFYEKWDVNEAAYEAKQIEDSADGINWRPNIIGPFKFTRTGDRWYLESSSMKGYGVIFPDFDYLEGEVKVFYGDKKLKYEKFIGFKL